MNPKRKALLFNFIGFAVLFLMARYALAYIIPINRIFLALIAAILANLLSPKFASIQTKEGKKVFMKWIFSKGSREL